MKWTTKPKPKDGDIRVVRSFAWLPTECASGATVWLRPIWLLQMWLGSCDRFMLPGKWVTHSWWDERPPVTITPMREAA